MTREELSDALNYVNSSREKRTRMSQIVMDNPHLIGPLIEIALENKDPISSKASWVLEFTVKGKLEYLFPYIDLFADHLGKPNLDSSIRPFAKICECLCLCYFSKTTNACQQILTDAHLEKIATACFDWLIGDHKVAAKAYSMTSLLLLGSKFSWIYEELQLVLEQNYSSGSAAYKARARHTLARLKGLRKGN
ncbi:MAG: adenylosuccinate lyase [Flavobacteriaceae bacterium]